MGNLFLKENLLTKALNRIVDCLYLSILWSAVSTPVVTAGMASMALYYTVHKCIYGGEGHIGTTFWKAFWQNWKQGCLLWLIMASIGLLMFSECYLTFQWCSAQLIHPAFFVVSLCVAGLLVMWLQFWFAYAARFEDSLKGVLRNSFLIAAANFGPSFLLMVVFMMITLIVSCMPDPLLMWVIFPGLYGFAVHQTAERLFAKYLPQEEPERFPEEAEGRKR